jgi:hypothetical protein
MRDRRRRERGKKKMKNKIRERGEMHGSKSKKTNQRR